MDSGNGSSRHIRALPDEGLRARDDRRPIGEIFVELGFVSRAQLDAALDEQHATGGRIGEILVEQGSLTRIDLASALAEHWEPHAYADESVEDSFTGAVRSVTEQGGGRPGPEPSARPRRGLLRRSSAREEPLEEHVERLAARLDALEGVERSLVEPGRSRTADALAIGARSATAEERIAELGEVEARPGGFESCLEKLGSNPDERLIDLSVRIDRAAKDSHDRIAALADELRVELAAMSARVEAQLQIRLEEAAALQQRFGEVQEAASGARAGVEERTAELQVEIGSLAGRIDELFGLRHADAQAARVANERLGTRLEGLIARQADEAAAALAVAMDSRDDPENGARVEESLDRLTAEIAELTRRLEQQDAFHAESQRAVLEGLTTLRKRLKKGKTGKGLRRSLDSLDAAIAAADARLAERDSHSQPES